MMRRIVRGLLATVFGGAAAVGFAFNRWDLFTPGVFGLLWVSSWTPS